MAERHHRLTAGEGLGVEFSCTGCRSWRHVSPGKKDSLTLLELVEGETAAIHALHNDGVTKKRIQALGLFEGRRVCVIARAPFSGPLLVEDVVTGARVMIARDLAENIEVASDGASSD